MKKESITTDYLLTLGPIDKEISDHLLVFHVQIKIVSQPLWSVYLYHVANSEILQAIVEKVRDDNQFKEPNFINLISTDEFNRIFQIINNKSSDEISLSRSEIEHFEKNFLNEIKNWSSCFTEKINKIEEYRKDNSYYGKQLTETAKSHGFNRNEMESDWELRIRIFLHFQNIKERLLSEKFLFMLQEDEKRPDSLNHLFDNACTNNGFDPHLVIEGIKRGGFEYEWIIECYPKNLREEINNIISI